MVRRQFLWSFAGLVSSLVVARFTRASSAEGLTVPVGDETLSIWLQEARASLVHMRELTYQGNLELNGSLQLIDAAFVQRQRTGQISLALIQTLSDILGRSAERLDGKDEAMFGEALRRMSNEASQIVQTLANSAE